MSSFVLFRSEILNSGHCEEMTPFCWCTATEGGWGSWVMVGVRWAVKPMVIDAAASDYEHRINIDSKRNRPKVPKSPQSGPTPLPHPPTPGTWTRRHRPADHHASFESKEGLTLKSGDFLTPYEVSRPPVPQRDRWSVCSRNQKQTERSSDQ